MRNKKNAPLIPFLGLSALVAVMDQLSKKWIAANLAPYESIKVIPGFFSITFVTNTGAAFGLFSGNESWRKILFLTITVLAMGFIIYVYKNSKNYTWTLLLGSSFVFGGALGNLVDRIFHSKVIDFFLFYLGRWSWPAFNVADTAITIGAFLIACHFFKE